MSSSINKDKLSPSSLLMAFLVLISIFVASYYFKDVLTPISSVAVGADETCDLRVEVCSTTLPEGGEVSFSIFPASIPLLTPLVLKVRTEGFEANYIDVDFVGIGMDMGFNRTRLVEEQSGGNGLFIGKGILPVCSRSKMDWEARVLLHTEKGTVTVPFRFYTNK